MTQGEKVTREEDLFNLLESAGWTDVIQPAIKQKREQLGAALVKAVLGDKITNNAGEPLSKEQLAGMIYGIDWIESLFRHIFRDGESASKYLSSQTYNSNS